MIAQVQHFEYIHLIYNLYVYIDAAYCTLVATFYKFFKKIIAESLFNLEAEII